MATQKQMFPITYKPGILRDGSPFQGSYSTSGQWVRFFRGQPQNIGGMRNYVLYLQTIPEHEQEDLIKEDQEEKQGICESCGKGKLTVVELGPRQLVSCSVCEYRKTLKNG